MIVFDKSLHSLGNTLDTFVIVDFDSAFDRGSLLIDTGCVSFTDRILLLSFHDPNCCMTKPV